MKPQPIDALFLSYFEDVDKWWNDHLEDHAAVTGMRADSHASADDPTLEARMLRQLVQVEGHFVDQPRLLSWARHGTTAEYRRYDAFAFSHLAGSYFRSLCGARGYDVRHINTADRTNLAAMAERVSPRWVLLSSTFLAEAARTLDVCRRLRQTFPDAGLVVGGLVLLELQKSLPEQSFQRLLRALRADAYVLTSEGEQALLELLPHHPRDLDRLELPKTWVRRGAGYELSTQNAELPPPFSDGWVRWSRIPADSLYHTVNVRTARSCAFKCSFCTFPVLQGGLLLLEPEQFRRELEELRALGTVRSLTFTDDTFNVPPKRFRELCRVLADFDFEWYSFFRPQFNDAETTQLMHDSGCRSVFLGIEAADDAQLRRMGKTAKMKDVHRGVELRKDKGIGTHANFIIGFPGEERANVSKIIPFLDQHEIDFFCISPWYHSPTAPIAAEEERYGIEGRFWRWKHNTMTIEEAVELEMDMLEAPKHSVFSSEIGQYTFWGEIQLLCNGLSNEEARQVMRTYTSLAGRDWRREDLERAPEVATLRSLLEPHAFPQPPGLGALSAPPVGVEPGGRCDEAQADSPPGEGALR